MQNEKKQKPLNAEAMSKTALIAEVRKLRKEAKEGERKRLELKQEILDLKNEIARRDNATAIFRDIEPTALTIAVIVYPLWEKESFTELDYGIRNAVGELILKSLGRRYTEFWTAVAFNKTVDFLETIKKAKER